MFALDTNTVIYFFKGTGRVKQEMLSVAPGQIALPAVVLFELERGCAQSLHPSRRQRDLELFLKTVPVIPFETRSARYAAQVAATLAESGVSIGPLDTLIADMALASNCTLVTHNTAEFSRVPGLQITDWF